MRNKLMALLFVICCCLTTIVFAQEIATQGVSRVSSLVPNLPESGTVDEEVDFPAFDATEWLLSNGARIILKPTNLKKGETLMKGFSWGGTSVITDPKEIVTRNFLNDLIRISGIGTLSSGDLSRLSEEKGVVVTPFVGDITDDIMGSAPTDEIETMLQLVYLYFTEQRIDNEAFKAYSNQLKERMNEEKNMPEVALKNYIIEDLYGNNPLKKAPIASDVKKINYEKGMALAKDRFNDIDNFTFIFVGDFNITDIQPLIELYIGGVKKSNRNESWINDRAYILPGNSRNDHEVSANMSHDLVYMLYFGKMQYSPKNEIYMHVLTRLLEAGYTDMMKDFKKDIQNFSLEGEFRKYPHELLFLYFRFDVTPQMKDMAINQIKNGMESMAATGPSSSDLKKIKTQLLKERQNALKTNQYYLTAVNDYIVLHFDKMENFETIISEMTEDSVKSFVNEVILSSIIKEVTVGAK